MSANGESRMDKNIRKSHKTRKNAVDYQRRILNQIHEMFDSILEPDVILSVVENCNWKLQSSIEQLITLSAKVDNTPNKKNGNPVISQSDTEQINILHESTHCNSDSSPDDDAFEVDTDFTYLNIDDDELKKQKQEFRKFELMKKHINDLPSVIKELPSEIIDEEQLELEKSKPSYFKVTSRDSPVKNKDESKQDSLASNQGLDSQNQSSQTSVQNNHKISPKLSSSESRDRRKTETESLCGLKVEYRFAGIESTSDDDADVVIEKEQNDDNVTDFHNTSDKIRQFLSLPSQNSVNLTTEMKNTQLSYSLSAIKNKNKLILEKIKSIIQNGLKIMIIMRGAPGSGKSHLAREIVKSTVNGEPSNYIFSADDFFVTRGRGVYQFDPTMLSDAHAFNQEQTLKAVKDGLSPVIIDNTNINLWEMKPYAIMAVKYGYFIEILEPDTPWQHNVNELSRRSLHGVPKESIRRMLERFDGNITSMNLLQMYNLKYDPDKIPPQPSLPPLLSLSPTKKQRLSFNSNRNKRRNNRSRAHKEADEELESYVPIGFSSAKVVDAIPNSTDEKLSALELAMKTFGVTDADDLSPLGNNQNLIEDKEWNDDGIGWEDEILNLEMEKKNADFANNQLRVILNQESSSMDSEFRNSNSQLLGAIGSERKNSPSEDIEAPINSESKNDNVLAQCWDFNLISGYEETQNVEVLIDDEKSEEKKSVYNSVIDDDLKESIDKEDVLNENRSNQESFKHENANSKNSSLDNCEMMEVREITKSVVNPCEIVDEFKTNPENVNIDQQAKVSFGSIMKFIKKSFMGTNNEKIKTKNIENVETCNSIDKLSLQVDNNNADLKNLHCESKVSDAICSAELSNSIQDSYNNDWSAIIKSSNDFGSMKSSGEENESVEIQILEESEKLSDNAARDYNNSDLSLLMQRENTNSNPIITPDSPFGDISIFNELSEMSEIILPQEENKELDNEGISESEAKNFNLEHVNTIDNINSVTWKESPFPMPIVELKMPIENSKNVLTTEAATNTNLYDFNVAYVGGTSEPEYKILQAFNRSINEIPVIDDKNNVETPLPKIFKLDKSSMTNEVDVLLKMTSEDPQEEGPEIMQEIIDMFPHIPKDYVMDVYWNLCKGDSDWAIDVLLDGVPSGGLWNSESVKSSSIVESSFNSSNLMRNKRMEKMKKLVNPEENGNEMRKKERNKISEDSLALKKYIEDKVMISEASYHPHILRVKKWKNKEPDMPVEIIEAQARNKDVIQFNNNTHTQDFYQFNCDSQSYGIMSPECSLDSGGNPVNEEESDGDDLSESEEIIELNLGWEFISNLEKECGNLNFQQPDGLLPIIQIKKSLAQELHSLWLESMKQQIDTQQEDLDKMIAKDAEYAKTLEVEEAKSHNRSIVPNLNEVMDMELALAIYKNNLKKKLTQETPDDMASRLTRQMLNEMFPDTESELLSEILKAHNGNFRETVEVLEASTGRSFSSTDALNKQRNLMAKVKQQSSTREEGEFTKPTGQTDYSNKADEETYEIVLQDARDSRIEAERQFSLRNENFNKANAAYRRGNPAVASYYSEMAKLHSKKMQSANAAAATAFLAAQTHILSADNTLDLHNLFVTEALQALDIFLDHHIEILNGTTNRRSVELLIITGWGARSNNRKSKIKPAVSKRLTNRNIRDESWMSKS